MFSIEPAVVFGIIGAASALFTIGSGLVFSGIKFINWLHEQFASLRRDLESLLDRHEAQDQTRHEDNLQRFTRLETIVRNGHKEYPSEEWNTRKRQQRISSFS